MHAATPGKQSVAAVAIPSFLIVLPVALFYGILFHCLTNLPLLDDYDALLKFLNQTVQEDGTAARFWLFLAGQHNEYKVFFTHGVAWAQVALLGHADFAQLCVLGNSAVLAVAIMLWTMFLPDQENLGKRLAFFVPVSWLLFQLGYWETLNWAMASLQNLWVIVFSFGTIRLLLRTSVEAYVGALVLYALAIATSGNGFLLLPIGLLVLAARRQPTRAAGWLAVSAVCLAAYAYHYNSMSSQAQLGGSVFATLLHLRPEYVVAFVGNAGAVAGSLPISVGICLVLGTVLLLLFGWLAWRGYGCRNPSVSCCVLFVLLTAVGVAGLRSELGPMQSLEPRYTIYGALLVILAWTAIAEEFLQHRSDALINNSPYLAMAVTAVLFALCMDEIGYVNLARREREAVQGFAAFEHPAAPDSSEGPVLPFAHETANLTAFRARARAILSESIRLGVYEPPRF